MLLVLCVILMCFASSVLAATPEWGAVDRAVSKENYVKAKELADAVLKRGGSEDRQKTMMVYGRILLGLGQKEQARQYLAMRSGGKNSSDHVLDQQLVVYGEWFKALDQKPDEAIKALEKMLKEAGNAPDESLAEAADVLAILYMARGDLDQAKKAVAFGIKVLQYRGIKNGYMHTLLHGRLKSNFVASEAKRLYSKAEELRSKGNFTEAGQIFTGIQAMYPQTSWGHVSGFRVGQCFMGLNQPTKAINWWQKFSKESPNGPWRGQAYVMLIDHALQLQLDLGKATELIMAVTATLDKPLDKEAEESWRKAAYDIYLRKGIVSLIEGRFDAAVQGFQQAKKAIKDCPNFSSKKTSPSVQEAQVGLNRLIKIAMNRRKLIPDELKVNDDRAATAIAIGNIYNILHEYDAAKHWFNLVLNGSLRSRSADLRSFAGLCFAHTVVASSKSISGSSSQSLAKKASLIQAKNIYKTCLKKYPEASWHDETLYGLATIIQNQADAAFDDSSELAVTDKKASQPAGKPGLQADLKSKQGRRVAWIKAKREALPYWKDLVERFPQSPRCEQAFYNVGVLLYEMAEVESAAKSDQRWKEADIMFQQLCERYPQSPYACDVYVRQIDFALERKFDVELATSLANRGIEWAKNQKVEILTTVNGILTKQSIADATKAIQNASATLPEWTRQDGKRPADLLNDLYNLYFRAGVLAYIRENHDQATLYFDLTGPARLTNGMEGRFDRQKVGVFILKNCCKRKATSWNSEAVNMAKTDNQKMILRLADTYLHAQRSAKAEAIYLQFLAGNSSLGDPGNGVKGYCLMQLALTYSERHINHDQSITYYKQFLKREYADLPWAPTAVMRLAVLEYNKTQDPHSSISYYQYVISKYPNRPEVERAYYFLSLDAVELGDKALAEASCKEYIKKYNSSEWENSGWRDHIQRVLKNEVPELPDNGKGKRQ